MTFSIIRSRSKFINSNFSRIAHKLAIIFPILGWTPIGEAQNLTSLFKDGIGLACEKEGNTNRKGV